jgi:hypothetical protein
MPGHEETAEMGKSITAPYVLELTCNNCQISPMCWFPNDRPAYGIKGQGKPTEANLRKHVEESQAAWDSDRPMFKHMNGTRIVRAQIRKGTMTGEVVARWAAPVDGNNLPQGSFRDVLAAWGSRGLKKVRDFTSAITPLEDRFCRSQVLGSYIRIYDEQAPGRTLAEIIVDRFTFTALD